jgi:hypothetical protein
MAVAYFFTFLPPLVAIEGVTLSTAMNRTSQLIGRKLFWRAWAAISCLPLLTFGLQFLTIWGISSLVALFKLPTWLHFLSSATIACVIGCFFQPYWMVFLTLFYFDARMRREGLDIRILAARLPAPAAENAPAGGADAAPLHPPYPGDAPSGTPAAYHPPQHPIPSLPPLPESAAAILPIPTVPPVDSPPPSREQEAEG